MSDDTPQEVQELRRAAVMFPRLFLWIIGSLMVGLTGLGGGGVLCVHASNTGKLSTAAADCGAGAGTVTNTGGALTANAVMLGAGGNDAKVVAGITTDGVSKVTLGVSGTNVGALALNNATTGTVTIQPTTGALGTVTVTLPAANSNTVQPDTGASNNFLTAISALGVISKAQPAFTNLSGSATLAQGAAGSEYISGLELSWVSASAIDILPGTAYIQSLGYAINVAATINLTSISLGNSAWGYVYLLSNGTGEVNTTAPAAAYSGNARSKTSDTSRSFLGAVRTDSSGNIYRFRQNTTTGLYLYQAVDQASTPFRVLSAGSATTSTAVSAAAVVPPQSRMLYGVFYNTGSTDNVFFGSADYTVSTTVYEINLFHGGTPFFLNVGYLTLNSSQQFNYLNDAVASNTYVDVRGYLLER